MLLGLILKILCALCGLGFLAYALMSNVSSLDPSDTDGIERGRRAKAVGWVGAATCAGLVVFLFVADALRSPIAPESMQPPVDTSAQNSAPTSATPPTNQTPSMAAPSNNFASNRQGAPLMSAGEAAVSGPPMGAPTGETAMNTASQNGAAAVGSSTTFTVIPEGPGVHGRLVTEPSVASSSNANRYPFSPVRLNVTLRYDTTDKVVRDYVARLVTAAERDSGIKVRGSSDKFACVRVTPKNCIVSADGQQSQLSLSKSYLPMSSEGAAGMALFHPALKVDLDEATGHRAEFSPTFDWSAMRSGYSEDVLEVDVFPTRHRVVVQASVRCVVESQYPDGLPSVYDLQGGQISLHVVRPGALPVPRLVDLDDADAHGASDASLQPTALAPKVSPSVLSFEISSSPPGSVELGVGDMTLAADRAHDGDYVITGPILLRGFPSSG